MASYRLTDEALSDLAQIEEYIREDSPQSAASVSKDLSLSLQGSLVFPTIGMQEDGTAGRVRRLLGMGKLQSYKIRYVIQGETIVVFQILHSARSDQAYRLPPKS